MIMGKFELILILIGIVLSSIGALLLKLGAIEIVYNKRLGEIGIQIISNWKIIAGLLFYFIPALIWIFLLKKINLTFLQPFFSLVYVVTPIFSIFFLGETISITRWIGIFVIILGLSITVIN